MASPGVARADQAKRQPQVSIGFTCICGERVTVYRLVAGKGNILPSSISVSCRNGHAATFLPEQFGFLDDWMDE